jgi:hypothetical protein
MKYFNLIAFIFLSFQFSFSEVNNGSVSGEVRDAVTKQPLPGANIVIAGTSLGTTCNEQGYYVIKNVQPGKYQLKATLIGYESSVNSDVVVSPQRNKKISFELKTTDIEMSAVDVQSDYFARPAENVVSMRTLSPEEIRRSPRHSIVVLECTRREVTSAAPSMTKWTPPHSGARSNAFCRAVVSSVPPPVPTLPSRRAPAWLA